jgi:YfiH family protein
VSGPLDPARWLTPDWPASAGVRAVCSTRLGPGVSLPPYDRFNLGSAAGDAPEAVAANRAALRDALGLPAEPRWLSQVHGARVVELDGEAEGGGTPPEADAAIARAPGVVLAILSADCLPVLLAADDGSEIAAIHAGWRGLAAGVIESAIERLRTPRDRLRAWLGPAIGPGAYEVGDDVRDAMLRWRSTAAAAFRRNGSKWHCDLEALARMRLSALGVSRVSGGTRCTYSEPGTFYSFRREGRTGRMASVLWRSGEPQGDLVRHAKMTVAPTGRPPGS